MRWSTTLFWYIFKDLAKIFLMASGALAGIMSFGGLLRPLTQNGLDGSQVALLLEYFMPAMSTYSLPIAALFATTVVYGRMSADNEITACRASGIGFLSMTTPAMLLGVLVAIGSMFLLCFTVPVATRKIELVAMSNIAKLMTHQIQQTHEMKVDDTHSVFAQDAVLLPPNPVQPDQQDVLLRGPLFVSYTSPPGKDRWYQCADRFWSSNQAIAHIRENPLDSSAKLTVDLTDGAVFPRNFDGPKSTQAGVGDAMFGPIDIPSRLEQKSKFLNIFELAALGKDPSKGQEVQTILTRFIKEDQAEAFIHRQIMDGLQSADARCTLQSGIDHYVIWAPGAKLKLLESTLTIQAGTKPIQVQQESNGQIRLTAEGSECRIAVTSDTVNDQAFVNIEMKDAMVDAGANDTPSPAPLSRKFVVPLPPEITAYKARTVGQYLQGSILDLRARSRLTFAWIDLVDHIRGEVHQRFAFVISCLLLVLVGSSLGMMFRSGNFLTAFAVSVVPAMLSTVLIVTGQHTAEATPLYIMDPRGSPLAVGIGIMWSGNIVIGLAAIILLWRLQRR